VRSSFIVRHAPFFCALVVFTVSAQIFPTNQPDPLLQLMMSQPPVDTQSPVVARSSFDPPMVRVGGETTYRVTLNALNDAISMWPDEMVAPAQLEMKAGARGQILQVTGTNYQPLTIINYRVRATAPGAFLVPQFQVEVYGKPVTIPGVRLPVVNDPQVEVPPPQRLLIEVADTNVFLGQSVVVRVMTPAGAGNAVQPLLQVQYNGEGFLTDPAAARQRIMTMVQGGRQVATYAYEAPLTPMLAGAVKLWVQAFTPGNRFTGALVISGQATLPGGPAYTLLESDPITLNVRPLPREGELAGFTGGVGQFEGVAIRLETNSVKVGNPVLLSVLIRGTDNLQRLVAPPPPRVLNWQVYPGESVMTNLLPTLTPTGFVFQPGIHGWEAFDRHTNASTKPVIQPGPAMEFTYTLVPLREEDRATPAIPFCYFDPDRRAYVDLTIPSLPITVLPGTGPTNELAWLRSLASDEPHENKPMFQGLAKTMGRTSVSLEPLQGRPAFLLIQLLPVTAFGGLWAWDRRRRYLEAHPDIVRRKRARQALRRQRRVLRDSAHAGDAARYATGAVTALQIACAPHYPAEPRALVCSDVLRLLDEPDRLNGTSQVVRRFFAATDAASFGTEVSDAGGLLRMQQEFEDVLSKLEAKL
jgi:hypothetical protein